MAKSRSALSLVGVLALLKCTHVHGQRRAVPEFAIHLDDDPAHRFAAVVSHFNASLQAFYKEFFANGLLKPLTWLALEELSRWRGPESAELQAEINGIAHLAGLPAFGIHAMQMLYELQTLMVPVDNITVPWRGPGCTGIVALNKADNTVYHARNLDFSPKKYMQDLVYTGVFKRGGQEVFRAQMVAAYLFPSTGMRRGPDGFAIEQNTRYTDHPGGDKDMLNNLFHEKRPLNGWVKRKVLETVASYKEAVEAMSTARFVAPEFIIMSGVRKGAILARSPDGVANRLVLGQPNYHCREDYIIATNFDFYWHDVREWFDYTSRIGLGHSRRVAAQKLLNISDELTPQVLFATINDQGVLAIDTIFQAIMNVETGLWNVSLPAMWPHDAQPSGSGGEKKLPHPVLTAFVEERSSEQCFCLQVMVVFRMRLLAVAPFGGVRNGSSLQSTQIA
eukprot:CAMPEP_0179052758 /NCGR_PEP_ID=MMETSP0796-20121207/21921_1 /TAXON_ID=73915 /ORGANISM="Pyrodinium bahamense, Strain pbaha01" /LENGTH=448 /DNA_ID=CAMNT_0020749331 /DNA_START=66 /DNA_END=1410 /DNA_ORIENTATION=+